MRYSSLIILMALLWSSCYSFKGTSISKDVKTFYIENFRNTASNAPAEIGNLFSDKLRDKVLRESRLDYSERDPSVEFTGTITGYRVSSVAPTNVDDDLVGGSLNRLSITVQIDYINSIDEEGSYSQPFTFFLDFDSSLDLFDEQERLIDEIFDQITEDVFNRAFSNW